MFVVVLQVLGNTEAGLQVLLESEDTTESITSGHPSCTILEMLQKIHERSVEVSVLFEAQCRTILACTLFFVDTLSEPQHSEVSVLAAFSGVAH